jgi:hypothetical protein
LIIKKIIDAILASSAFPEYYLLEINGKYMTVGY